VSDSDVSTDESPVPGAQSFVIGPKARAFQQQFFPDTTDQEWCDWHWQMRARLRTPQQLQHVFQLSADELAASSQHRDSLPVGITPYYAALMDRKNPEDPLH
jgi:lysine 2,3-aminomutase